MPRVVRFATESFQKRMILVYCSLLSLFMGTNPLILKEFVIPPKLIVGSTVTLSCVLDLDGDILQSIKWYKDGIELCSYGFFAGDHEITHRLLGVDELKCGNTSIRFGPISVTASGTYKCEASSIARLPKTTKPTVQTVMGSRNLSVFAYPMDAPIISGLKTHYHAGEFIEAQCAAPPSYPAPEMSWSINGKSVDNFKTNMKVHDDRGLLRATLSVKLMADAGLFSNAGAYALFVCTSVLMDTPPMTADAKVYWSTEPSASTETNYELSDSSGNIFGNSDEDEKGLSKHEPPDQYDEDFRRLGTREVEPELRRASQNVPEQRQASRGSLPGSRAGVNLVTVCLSAISLVCTLCKAIQLTS